MSDINNNLSVENIKKMMSLPESMRKNINERMAQIPKLEQSIKILKELGVPVIELENQIKNMKASAELILKL